MKRECGDLWRRYKLQGDAGAREALILAYTPLVKHVVDRMNITPMAYMDRDDLLTHAIIGLIDAIDKCDLERWQQFEAYARARVRGAVIDGIREMDWVPRVTRRTANQVENMRAHLSASLGRGATTDELAQALDLDVERVRSVTAGVERGVMLSLDDPVTSGEGDSVALADAIPNPNSLDPASRVDFLAQHEALAEAIRVLEPDERLVITLYYYEDLTLREIGQVLNRTEARVCQIHKAAIRKIQECLLDAEEVFLAA